MMVRCDKCIGILDSQKDSLRREGAIWELREMWNHYNLKYPIPRPREDFKTYLKNKINELESEETRPQDPSTKSQSPKACASTHDDMDLSKLEPCRFCREFAKPIDHEVMMCSHTAAMTKAFMRIYSLRMDELGKPSAVAQAGEKDKCAFCDHAREDHPPDDDDSFGWPCDINGCECPDFEEVQ